MYNEVDLIYERPVAIGGHSTCAFAGLTAAEAKNLGTGIQQKTTESAAAEEKETASASPEVQGGEAKSETASDKNVVLVTFGGADPFGIVYNSVFATEIQCGEEGKMKKGKVVVLQANQTGNGPKARTGHSAVPMPSTAAAESQKEGAVLFAEFLVFGGMAPIPNQERYGDLWIMGVHRGCAVLPAMDAKKKKVLNTLLQWTQPPTSGTAPEPRNDHGCCVVGDHMYVVGGTTEKGISGECYALSVSTMTWRQIQMPAAFIPREMMGVVKMDSRTALVVGGKSEEALLGDAWALSADAVAPLDAKGLPMRCCHTAVVLGGQEEGKEEKKPKQLMLCGGLSDGNHMSDALVELEWNEVNTELSKVAATKEMPRVNQEGGNLLLGFGHSGAAIDGKLFFVGGILPHAIGSSMQVFEYSAAATQR